MSRIVAGTSYVSTDEPCMSLVEMNLVRPDSKGVDRYMILTVMRGEKLEEFRIDLGKASEFKAMQFRILGGAQDPKTGRIYIEHNVAELVETANQLREGLFEPPEIPDTTDLIGAYYDQPDIRRRVARGTSTFGYGGIKQRS